jgi:hypothetical protein
MLSAKARGELIETRLAQLQASFLLTAMRRQALALPKAYCDRLAAAGDPLEVKAILDAAMRGLLAEVQDLPNRIGAGQWAKFSRRSIGRRRAGCQIRQAGTSRRRRLAAFCCQSAAKRCQKNMHFGALLCVYLQQRKER